jgi:cysteine-rich repeat protein
MAIAASEIGAHAFTIAIDARMLSAPQFEIDGISNMPSDTVATVDLTAAAHTFSPDGPGFSFVVTAEGTLDFDAALDGYVSGRGTSTLTVTGLAINFDATAMSSPAFNIDRGKAGSGSTDQVQTLRLLPGSYSEFDLPASNPSTSFPFVVTAEGTLDFDAALDGYVSGRGTSTLTVTGLGINFDATAMSSLAFNIDRGKAGIGSTDQVQTLRLLPGRYSEFDLPASSPSTSFPFVVSTSGTVDFDPAVDAYVSGRGTSTLTVTGLALIVDATRLSTLRFGILTGHAGVRLTASPAVMRLLPGDYTFNSPNTSNSGFSFTFMMDGTVTFDAALDPYVSGRGTATLTVLGFPITLDLRGATAEAFNLDGGAEGNGSTCAPATLRLLPGGRYSVEVPASTQPPVVALTVTTAGTLDYVCDPMVDSCTENCVSGRGTNLVRITCGPRTQCGNGIVETCEQCDDGNTASGDCCSPTCQLDASGTACTDDGNVCTDDLCNGLGGCNHLPNTRPCDDGSFCDGPDRCSGGSCIIHNGDPCLTGALCNNMCNEAAHNCASPTGTACPDDGNLCTDDACDGKGSCVHPANTKPCDDGDACTRTDTCHDGRCTGGNPVVCTAPDQCHDGGTCDPITGLCSGPERADGTACDDGNACTRTDTCRAGVCVGANPVACTVPDVCHEAGSCDPRSGQCSGPPKPDGSSCNDGDPCTTGDRCQAGACQGGSRAACIPAPDAPIPVPPGPAPAITVDVERPLAASDTRAAVSMAGYLPSSTGGAIVEAFGWDREARVASQLPATVRLHRGACESTAPPGTVRVTNCATKPFKRHKTHVSVDLRLNKLGRKLLNEQGSLAVQAAGAVRERQGSVSPLDTLLHLLKSS